MKNDYNVENVVKFVGDFVKQEEHFDSMFFEKIGLHVHNGGTNVRC